MLKVKSLEEFNAAFPPGKVLVFTRNAADAVDALHAILANHRERNDEIILCESEVGSTSIGFSSVLSSLNIPLDHISEEACVAISRLIEIEKPTNVYIPSFAFPFAFLALQVWEGVRRSAHRISIGVSELDQPLADVSVWVEHHTAHNTNSLKAHYLHSFRASCYGSELQGNALLIIDPKDTLAPYVPDRRPLIVKSDPLVTVIIRSAARGSASGVPRQGRYSRHARGRCASVNAGRGRGSGVMQ